MEAVGLFWFGAFTLTGLWFWALVVAWVAVTFINVHHEKPGWATLWLFLFLAALHLGGVVDVIHLVWTRPWLILGVLGGYVLAGLIWAVFKFKFWLRQQRIRINEKLIPALRQRFMMENHVSGEAVPTDLQEFWRRTQQQDHYLQMAILNMEVRQNKSRLTLWAIWWPVSVIWTVISDWVTEMFNWLIFDVLGKFLNSMVDSEKAKITVD